MLENEQQNQEDPKTNLLNLDSGIEFIKPIRHKSSYYEQDFYVEPWDENQDNFLQLSPKQKEEQPQDRKTRSIKIKLPQSRTQSRQRSNETHQTVQLTLPYHDRAGSCHTLFQDQGFINDKAAYKNIVDRVRSIQINKNQIIQNNKNNNKQISLKFSANKKKIKQIVQVKQKNHFHGQITTNSFKNHNQIKPNKQQNPQITGYTIQINKSLQQKVDKDSIVRNFRLKSNYTKTIA